MAKCGSPPAIDLSPIFRWKCPGKSDSHLQAEGWAFLQEIRFARQPTSPPNGAVSRSFIEKCYFRQHLSEEGTKRKKPSSGS